MASFILALSSINGTHTIVWIFGLCDSLYFVIGPQQAGSSWIALMPQA